MGLWLSIAIMLFVVGSIMALKPSGVEQRLDKLRMTARQVGLTPKLVACPNWLKGQNDELGKGMMGQYGLLLSDVNLPHHYYQNIDGQWRPLIDGDVVDNLADNMTNKVRDNTAAKNTAHRQRLFSLDKTTIALPDAIAKHSKGLETKANHIVLYWQDTAYVKPQTHPNYHPDAIEADMLAIKSALQTWAKAINDA